MNHQLQTLTSVTSAPRRRLRAVVRSTHLSITACFKTELRGHQYEAGIQIAVTTEAIEMELGG